MIIDQDAYLEHYGVKGMRWGQRRARSGASKNTKGETAVKVAAAVGAYSIVAPRLMAQTGRAPVAVIGATAVAALGARFVQQQITRRRDD